MFDLIFKEGHKMVGEAMSHCLTALAPTHVTSPWTWSHYAFTLHGDPCIQLLGEERGRNLQIFQPKGCEVIQQGDDIYIRWNAAGMGFGHGEKIKLEYSPDGGFSWENIPGAQELPYNDRLFIWQASPLPVGSEYRFRVTSLSDRSVSHASGCNFTIANLGLLTVKSTPFKDLILSGTHANLTDYNISILPGETVSLMAPNDPPLDFIRWHNAQGKTLCNQQEYTFTFEGDATIVAQYEYTGSVAKYYVNDGIAENGVAVGNDDNDGLTPQTPKRHIQAILDQYPEVGWGAIINVSEGIYEENINLSEENTGLEIKGAGQYATIVDGGHKGSCFYLDGLEAVTISDLTITNGSAQSGGGIHCNYSSPTIIQCILSDNHAQELGGGIYINICETCYPKFIDCIFTGNHSERKGGAVNSSGTHPEFIRCEFTSNSSVQEGGAINGGDSKIIDCQFVGNIGGNHGGGAICNREGAPFISSCVFQQNHSNTRGGAVSNIGGRPTIENCIFIENSAKKIGGAIAATNIRVIINNCTFAINSASTSPYGGGMYIESASDTTITNCIFWNNVGHSAPELYVKTNLTISYTDVKGGRAGISLGPDAVLTWGEGNINADPLFVDPDNGDYHPKSKAGRWVPNSESWIIDDVTSPCIDVGDPNSPIGDEPMPNGGRINMGAYGGTVEASKSP